jgi:hypothetical protein
MLEISWLDVGLSVDWMWVCQLTGCGSVSWLDVGLSVDWIWVCQLTGFGSVSWLDVGLLADWMWVCQLTGCGSVSWLDVGLLVDWMWVCQLTGYGSVSWLDVGLSVDWMWFCQLLREDSVPCNLLYSHTLPGLSYTESEVVGSCLTAAFFLCFVLTYVSSVLRMCHFFIKESCCMSDQGIINPNNNRPWEGLACQYHC